MTPIREAVIKGDGLAIRCDDCTRRATPAHVNIFKVLERRLRKPENDICAMPVEDIAAYMVCHFRPKNVTARTVEPAKLVPVWIPFTSRKQRFKPISPLIQCPLTVL